MKPAISALTEHYELRLSAQPAELRAAQRLRYEVFNLELNEGLASAAANGYDSDQFDDVCDHLLVLERATGAVVGTYRLQTGPAAAAHLGYYSEREFDFKPFESVRPQMVELGRACVGAAHRNQTVLGLLWKGIAQYARDRGARYLVGCSSITSQDEAAGLAVYGQLAQTNLADPQWRTQPNPAWRCSPQSGPAAPTPIPRLMRAYLAIGVKICGEPAIDREFRTIDFLTWVDLDALPERVLRKYFT
ncbi:MAG: GNAT family N-acetyltransferase [Opitutae bacterium]|nr:GNAT family N-acetyltransferase [Opitutae bacterium]